MKQLEKAYDMFRFMVGHPEVKRMKKYRQHRNTDTYSHCYHVTLKSIWIIRRTGLSADIEAVIRGAMLHDFYLYDATAAGTISWRHGWTHPEKALANAEKIFCLSTIEKNIIYSHMWPMNITHIPKFREAVIVNIADKMCAVEEIFLWGRRKAGISAFNCNTVLKHEYLQSMIFSQDVEKYKHPNTGARRIYIGQ